MKAILTIAENEFSMLARNPVVILFGTLMFILALINAAGCSALLPSIDILDHSIVFFIGVGNFFWIVSMFFAFLSMCIGIISITDERSKSSLRVLITKPLYRRDVIMGKFFGISIFLLLFIFFTVTLFISLMMTVYEAPDSIIELILRMGSFVFILFFCCSFTLGLVMLFGILLSKAEALILSLAFMSFEWLPQTPMSFFVYSDLQIIDPIYLFHHAIFTFEGDDLFTTTLPFIAWLNHALPYVIIMIAEVLIIVLLNSILFNREEI